MSKAAQSVLVLVFAFYFFGLGLVLVAVPNVLLRTFGLAPRSRTSVGTSVRLGFQRTRGLTRSPRSKRS